MLRELQKENDWWSSGEVPPERAREFKRADFYPYRDKLDQESAKILIGPRQVGKSTIFYQLIQYLIKDRNISPKRIILLSLDRPFFEMITDPLADSLRVFEENVLKDTLSGLKEPVYVFLDEASRVQDWALKVKECIDRKYKIRFFITGSSGPALFQKSSESLVGRWDKTLMLTLKFSDTLEMKNKLELNELMGRYWKQDLREDFTNSIKENSIAPFFDALTDIFVALGTKGESKMRIELNDYLLRGGYPVFYDKKTSWQQTAKTLREAYFDSIISVDISDVFGLRNPDKLKQLYTFLAHSTAQTINVEKLLPDLGKGIKRNTVDEYIYYLQQTYMIRTARTYKKNLRHSSNDMKKFYVVDVGLRNAVLGVNEEEIKEPMLIGRLAETVAHDHTLRLKYCLEPLERCEIYFWKDKQKREVDIIAEFQKKIIPIEVKYQKGITGSDIAPLKNAVEEFKSPYGILITKSSLQYNDNIISVPLWLYLLMC